MHKFMFAGALAVLAACAPARAQDTTTTTIVEPMTAEQYVATAASSDLFETQSSQLALQTTRTPAVREFAQHMVTDHSATTQKLTAAATAEGITVPASMIERHAQMLAKLQGTDAASFDAAYLEAQLMAHQEAVAVHTAYSQKGDDEALRTVAAGAVPIVTEHLADVQKLAR